MRIVLTIFAPFLVAVILRLALVLLALLVVSPWSSVWEEAEYFAELLADFDTFSWDESWLYWICVGIGSFFAEMSIWSNEDRT